MKEVDAPNCENESDLISFLYGELNEDQSRIFRSHLNHCAGCRRELASFQEVRESVVTWRNESLGGVSSAPAVAPSSLPVLIEKPSALAAFRQFFNLAPLWMKGSIAVASILFCLFAGLAIARLQSGAGVADKSPVVQNPSGTYSRQQLEALVEQRVQAELQRIKQTNEQTPTAPIVPGLMEKPLHRRVPVRTQELASNARARRPLSKIEREQLAADLGLVAARNESDLDLLDDGVNQ